MELKCQPQKTHKRRDRSAYNAAYRLRNQERLKAYHREYGRVHREKLNSQKRAAYDEMARQRKRAYYQRNREALLAQKRDYLTRKRDSILSYRRANAARFREKCREWHQLNKEKVRQRKRRYNRNRMISPQVRIAMNTRRMLNKRVARQARPNARTEGILGCSFADFCIHLERLFHSGMKWDNYGKDGWHIDHIIPCAHFDLTQPAQVLRCFHFTNLQPLWALDNIRKGSRLPTEIASHG